LPEYSVVVLICLCQENIKELYLNYSKGLFLLVFVFVSFSLSGQEQPVQSDYTDEELIVFMEAFQNIQTIEQETQNTIVEMVQNTELGAERFMVIHGYYNGNTEGMTEESTPSPDEESQYEEIMASINSLQNQARSIIEDTLVSAEMDFQEFQSIFLAIQSSPELQERIGTMF